jgi:serine/threonine protein kinase
MGQDQPSNEGFAGKYRVLAQLGQGGTANVMLAVARGPSGFNKLVVLKSMKSHLKDEPEFGRMFLSEARLAARLNHPNVVQTNEVVETPDGPVIIMEYLEGQSLAHLIAKAGTKLSLTMHLRILSEALSGLHHAHDLTDFDGSALGMVHRDVSPHNVFVTFDGQVKILDFGIAKLTASQTDTATGVLKGKLRYMSPEQITNEGVDRRVDVYAAGVMVWEAAAGKKMWRGVTEAQIMNRILNGEPPKVTEENPDVDPELIRIIDKALATDPADRYPTVSALQEDLETFLASAGSNVRLREIGKLMIELFADERVQTKKLVEDQLAKVASLSSTEYSEMQPIELTHIGAQGAFTASATRGGPENSRRATLAVVIAAIAVATFGFLIWRIQGSQKPAGSASSDQSSPVASATSAEPDSRIQIHVTAFPENADIYVDGERAPTNPFSSRFAADAKVHHIEARAAGHVNQIRDVRFDEDADLVLTLVPEPVVSSSALPSASVKRPVGPVGPVGPVIPPTKPKPNCDPPFAFDANHIKRYKPECL